MASLDEYNFIKMTETMLLTTIKERVVDSIVNKMVADFKEKAEQEVRQEVEKLSIEGVKSFRDMVNLRDEFKVYCEWNGN